MGTFHDDRGDLHGVTVVAFAGDTVYVGRCHEMDGDRLMLLDVDEHSEGEEGRSNREYLARAAKFGVWKKHDRLLLPMAEIRDMAPLGDFHEGVGRSVPSTPAAIQVAPVPAAASPTGAAGEGPVQLTDGARAEVHRLLAREKESGRGLRLGVAGGGCSGLVYKVEFDSPREGDVVIKEEGFEVFLDQKSIIYLRGVVLDFQDGLAGRGFQFNNPNAGNTCGCGESIAV